MSVPPGDGSPFRVAERTTHIPTVPEAVFEWHARPGALERLIPPWESVEVVERAPRLADGARVTLRIRQGPLTIRWVAVHRDTIPGRQFIDEQAEGPFSHWIHTHRMDPAPDGGCLLSDRIEYAPPFGIVGAAAGQWCIGRQIERLLQYRHDTTREDLAAHARFQERPRLTVAVTGSHGLIGSALVPFLETGGHRVVRMVRSRPEAGEVMWDASTGRFDPATWPAVDAVVHLAGENIAGSRWTESTKARLRESRVRSTRGLCQSLAALDRPPRVFVAASAIGFYGDRAGEVLSEGSPPGTGFLADLAREWEAASEPAASHGIRVVQARFGVVLSPRGGALGTMLPFFKLGLGGRLGPGTQWMSWVSIDDAVGAIHHALQVEELSGPVNVVAPGAVANRAFTETLGRVLGRPTFLPVPAPVLRLTVGEMADAALLASARVVPSRLGDVQYHFRHPSLDTALSHVLGRPI